MWPGQHVVMRSGRLRACPTSGSQSSSRAVKASTPTAASSDRACLRQPAVGFALSTSTGQCASSASHADRRSAGIASMSATARSAHCSPTLGIGHIRSASSLVSLEERSIRVRRQVASAAGSTRPADASAWMASQVNRLRCQLQ